MVLLPTHSDDRLDLKPNMYLPKPYLVSHGRFCANKPPIVAYRWRVLSDLPGLMEGLSDSNETGIRRTCLTLGAQYLDRRFKCMAASIERIRGLKYRS
jgi:hypothetical protein